MSTIFDALVHPLERRAGALFRGNWRLQGYDTYADEWYPLPGRYLTERAAQRAARLRLRRLEKLQPASTSGGQASWGIQDRVFIIRPDGSTHRYLPQE